MSLFKSARQRAALLSLGLAITLPAVTASAEVDVLKITEVDPTGLTFADGSQTKFSNNINGRTFGKQNAVTSFNGYQYTTYYDKDRYVVLGRRELPDGEWELIRFQDYNITSSDAHNITSVGICEGDGTIHLSFDHHKHDLNYRVSEQGVATNPKAVNWTKDLFGPVTDQLGSVGKLTNVTYPRFFNAPNGNLMLYYRDGGSGNGRGALQEYDATTHDWTTGLGTFISSVGLYSGTYTSSSSSRNPYLNGIFYAGDRLHVSWGWRETTSSRSNHDVCYAYSDDHGRTWYNTDGIKIGTIRTRPMIVTDPGLVVGEIPQDEGLTNQYTSYYYPDGRASVMVYHSNRYEHYFRTVDGTWDLDILSFVGSRPDIAGDKDGNLFLVYSSGGRLKIAKGTPNSEGTAWTWKVIYTRGDATEMGEGIYDRSRWETDRILSVFGQEQPPQTLDYGSGPMIDGIPAPVHIIDFHVSSSAVLPVPRSGAGLVQTSSNLTWTPGQGATAHQLYIGSTEISVKRADTSSPEYMGEVQTAEYTPASLEADQTYFWRVDQVQSDGSVVKGAVWSFTTASDVVVTEWAGYPVSEAGDVNTDPWMGFLNVTLEPYVWSYSLNQWTYIEESIVTEDGSWTYFLNL